MDASGLVLAVGRLARVTTGEFDLDDMLVQLGAAAADALSVHGAGVVGLERGRIRRVHVSAGDLEHVELLQETLQQGPCRDAVNSGRPVVVTSRDDMAVWPGFREAAAAVGVSTVVALPLSSPGRCWGALNLYWTAPHVTDDHELAAAQLLADVAVSYLVMNTERVGALAAQRQLAERAMRDELTGLPNRALLHELTDHALAAAERHRTCVAVLFIDLDEFKPINDTYGHLAGDVVLQEIGRRLRAVIRTNDTVGRLSGDEFLIVCEDLATSEDDLHTVVTKFAARVTAAVTAPIRVPTTDNTPAQPGTAPLGTAALSTAEVIVTCSVGAAITSNRPSAADLIHEADMAMYEAKASGPGCVVIHDELSTAPLRTRRGMERTLSEALHRREFEVHYQPIVTAAGAITAVEALLRWRHPDHGLLPAAEFVAAAEATGAIIAIGRWVIDQALQQLHHWQQTAPHAAPQLVFCNLSPRELAAPDLPDSISTTLRQHALTPDRLGIEVVEAHLADTHLADAVRHLNNSGHRIAVDDFGTGYSSLARLVDLPAAYLKVDRSLVAGLPHDPRSRTLIDAVLTMAARLHVQVITEGIETPEQAAYLAAAGADLLQGHHYGPPVPAHHITDMLVSTSGPHE